MFEVGPRRSGEGRLLVGVRTTKQLMFTTALGVLAASCGPADPASVDAVQSDVSATSMANDTPVLDSSGVFATHSTAGSIDLTNPFFSSLGTNGRSCGSCHGAQTAFTVVPSELNKRFKATRGLDPVFALNDGANSPNAPVATLSQRQAAFSMLLSKGVFRVGIGVPAAAEFTLSAVDDPYGFASAAELSLFRRPLPSTNLSFLSAVMWDGRETITPITSSADLPSLTSNLAHQSVDATLGHAQAAMAPTAAQQEAIVGFEMSLYTAQTVSNTAGSLTTGALGGPIALASQPFFIGINDPLGNNPTGADFSPTIFALYDAKWAAKASGPAMSNARAAVLRGQALFNTRPIALTGVGGLNDALGQTTISGFCGTCHDSPNVGNHSVSAPLNIGIADGARRTPDMPLYTLTCVSGPLAGSVVQTTDPGRALITGKCADIGKFKGPVLRALAARAPYFHDGSAPDLPAVVSFYNQRFSIGLTPAQQADLAAFLATL